MYNAATFNIQSRVLPQAERLEALGAKGSKPLPEFEPAVRPPEKSPEPTDTSTEDLAEPVSTHSSQ